MRIQNQPGTASPRPALPLPGTLRAEQPETRPQARELKRAFLTVIRSRADLGVHTVVEGRTVIGRDPSCTFSLRDHQVSRKHAAIIPVSVGRYLVQDLGSTNGTRVGGTLIDEPRLLREGEKLQLGETVIRFSLADENDIDFQREIAMLVGTDPLTGLPSKRRFDEAFEFALLAAVQAGDPLAVLMMDMDGVKQINDTHGHLFGAHAIGEAGRCIARVLDGQGGACRFGGDEFCVFLPGHDTTSAAGVAEQIRSAVANANMIKDGIPLAPTISIGVASYPEAGGDPLDLVTASDAALYRAKALGKNRVAT